MKTFDVIEKANKLIEKYFADKVDAGGNPYIYHLSQVAGAVSNEQNIKCKSQTSTLCLFYEKAYIVALLHDIFEDTECTEDELKEIGCDEEIIEALHSLTHEKNEFYIDYIERVNKNDIARLVKIYDLENNMDITRLNSFGDYEQKRLKKYWYCWKYLKGEISVTTCSDAINPNRKKV